MFDLIFKKDDSFFYEKQLTSTQGAPKEMDAKFKLAIEPIHDTSTGIWQFHDNCHLNYPNSKVPDCC